MVDSIWLASSTKYLEKVFGYLFLSFTYVVHDHSYFVLSTDCVWALLCEMQNLLFLKT